MGPRGSRTSWGNKISQTQDAADAGVWKTVICNCSFWACELRLKWNYGLSAHLSPCVHACLCWPLQGKLWCSFGWLFDTLARSSHSNRAAKKEKEGRGAAHSIPAQQLVAVVQARPHTVAALVQSSVARTRSHHATVHRRPQGVQCPQAQAQRWYCPISPAKPVIFVCCPTIIPVFFPRVFSVFRIFAGFSRTFACFQRHFQGIFGAFLRHFALCQALLRHF